MNTEQFDKLVNQGRALLVSDKHVGDIHRDFNKWFENVSTWLQEYFPNSALSADWSSLGTSNLLTKRGSDDSASTTWLFQTMVQTRLKWLSNLMTALQNTRSTRTDKPGGFIISRKVFIVHGRNNEMKETLSRFLEKLGLEPIILHEQPNAGKTIIEKFLEYADVSFAVILMTPDDTGGLLGELFEKQKPRARQNVILELGFFLGRIGREKTCIIYDQTVERPSDYDGVLYIPLDDKGAWQLSLAKEMKNALLPFDMNALLK
ncbi:MAG: nucleotide-binding protein [Anaerolineales bacterium]|nr:nucleotide-binding protein [Anaerolineales bacterium]